MMSGNFIEKPIDLKDLPKGCPVDPCLLENNEKQISKFCEFLQSDKKLLLVNGFRGSGKTQIVNFVTDFLKPDVIFLHYTCLETSTVDDMFLAFFEFFKVYVQAGQISAPKIKADNFTQKINSYFNTITNPILIVLDSFDTLMKENKIAIADFIKHLSKFDNVKTVVVSKGSNDELFSEIEYENITILPLSQKIFEKYLRRCGIKQIGIFTNELYKVSKGYFGTIVLTVNIISLRQLTLMKFFENFSQSYMSFSEYIIKEAISLIDPVSAHLFRLLAVMRIPIHIKLLKFLHLYDEERIAFFINNSILSYDGASLYLKEEFRDVIELRIPDNVRIKLHKACIDLYNTQLPLKPSERDLLLSRQTMRHEIEYHEMFIPYQPDLTNAVELTADMPKAVIPENKQDIPPAAEQSEIKQETPPETKEEKINKISFIIEDESLLDGIADSIKGFIDKEIETSKLEQASSSMPLAQIINAAGKEEKDFNYKHAIMLYQQALTKTNDEDFYTFLPTIYLKLAKNYKKLSDWYEALEYYTQAQDFYVNVSNNTKVAEIKLEIANIYYAMYKPDNAKFILNELEKQNDLPNELMIKINLATAKISNDPQTEYECFKKSVDLITSDVNKAIVAKLYYKFAVCLDDMDDIKAAVKYYKKCIEIQTDNKYMSNALSNLAQLYDEAGSQEYAVKYYSESIDIDTKNNNYSGLYSSYLRLGEIYSASDKKSAAENFEKAITCAIKTSDEFCMANAHIITGDFYFDNRDYETAYKNYAIAGRLNLSKENSEKVESRKNNVKSKVSDIKFNEFREKYGE